MKIYWLMVCVRRRHYLKICCRCALIKHIFKCYGSFMRLQHIYMYVLLLLCIAVQRYLKVLTPISRQMSIKSIRVAMILPFCQSLIFAGPMISLNEAVPFTNKDGSIIGMRRSKMKNRGSGLDCGSEDPGSIPGLPSPRVGLLMARRFGRPSARVRVGSAR